MPGDTRDACGRHSGIKAALARLVEWFLERNGTIWDSIRTAPHMHCAASSITFGS
jgi:hypothetical protein